MICAALVRISAAVAATQAVAVLAIGFCFNVVVVAAAAVVFVLVVVVVAAAAAAGSELVYSFKKRVGVSPVS